MDQALLSFNAGEVSPYLRHRIDFEKTSASCELMQNMIAQPYGGAVKRPGLRYLGETAAAGRNSRLLPWIGSDGSRYLLHFTLTGLTIYTPEGAVDGTLDFMDGYDWPDTFSWENSLRDIQIVQVNDVAFITHPGLFPMRLSHAGGTWAIEFIPFTRAPLLDENLDESLLLSVFSNPIADLWAGGATYSAGDVVRRGGAEWTCLQNHIGSEGTTPGQGEDWKGYWTRKMYVAGDPVTLVFNGLSAYEWERELPYVEADSIRVFRESAVGGLGVYMPDGTKAVVVTSYSALPEVTQIESASLQATAFNVTFAVITSWGLGGSSRTAGEYIWHLNHLYLTTGSFTPASNLEPGVGAIWETMMVDVCDVAGIVHFPAGLPTPVKKGTECVAPDGKLYRALKQHSPDVSPEPGTGADWESFWVEIDEPSKFKVEWYHPYYLAGERVHVAGTVYECTVDHYRLDKNKPGTGSAWEDFWVALADPPAIFDALHAASDFSPGSHWRVSPEREKKDFQVEFGAITENNGAASPFIAVQGPWTFNTFGTWWGTFDLERSPDAGRTWEVIRSWQASGDRNVADSGVEDAPVLLRLRFTKEDGSPTETDIAASTGTQRGVLAPEKPYVTGYALADTFVSSNVMTGFAQTSILSGRTFRWSEGAFSGYQGFPRALALHETRLAFGGTARRAVSLWFSQTDDLLNFEAGVEATDGIYATLALTSASAIRWMASQRRLFIGTAWGEWVTGSESTDQPLSPTNFMARQYSGYGSLAMQPLIATDAIFFAERKGNRLREMSYFSDREAYDAADLSRLAEHLTAPGISNMAWQQTREPGLWVVRRDGVLLHFAYSRTDRVSAWSRHITGGGGLFRDVVVLPSDAGDDEVFFIIDRDGGAFLERFPQHWLEAQESASDGLGFFHVDGVAGSGTSISLPDHLVGQADTWKVTLRNSTPAGIPTAVQGSVPEAVTALDFSSDWQVGFPVVSRLDSLPIDLQAQDGTTQGRMKRMHKAKVSIFRSRGGTVWNVDMTKRQDIPNTQATQVLRTGWEEVLPDPGTVTDLQFRFLHDEPFPFTLRAAVVQWNLHEK